AMVWLPTDGNDTPDFLIPAKDTGQITIYTGFNVALNGPFNEVFFAGAKNQNGISISDIYSFIFEFAKKNRNIFKGVVSAVIIGEISGLYSSGIKKSPLKKNEPKNKEMVMHRDNLAEWIDLNNEPKYNKETIISFGIGVDLTSDLNFFDQNLLNSISYVHPANKANQKLYLHNHGVVFKNIPVDKTIYIDDTIKKILAEGDFLDMRHLLDNTKLENAIIGVSYISNIVKE
ncbi:anti-anti-sigma factor, partial [Candidatus Dependentiae bacterium]|nr:anti-anti-sigma factor [Candidatus Dependentiae bacterium]